MVKVTYKTCAMGCTHDYAVALAPGTAVLKNSFSINSVDWACLRGYLLEMSTFEYVGQRMWEADVDGDGTISCILQPFLNLLLNKNLQVHGIHSTPTYLYQLRYKLLLKPCQTNHSDYPAICLMFYPYQFRAPLVF